MRWRRRKAKALWETVRVRVTLADVMRDLVGAQK